MAPFSVSSVKNSTDMPKPAKKSPSKSAKLSRVKSPVVKAPKVSRPSKIVILDFGSQYTQVIARRVRECSVYSEILPHTTKASEIAADGTVKGIILAGGPASG